MTDLTRRKKELLNSYNNLCSCYGDIISEQAKTINQLKELLKEWVQFEIEENPNDFTVISERMSELTNKTNSVIGEKYDTKY